MPDQTQNQQQPINGQQFQMQQQHQYGFYNQQQVPVGWNPQQFNNYGYRQWQMPQGFQFQPVILSKSYAKDAAKSIFNQSDKDFNGMLDLNEAPLAIQSVYSQFGIYPTQDDIMFAFREFDDDGSGYLDQKEFQRLIRYLSGNRKSSKKSKKQKEKKSKKGTNEKKYLHHRH